MIMLAGITDLEGDAHLRIERLHMPSAKVSGNIKTESVGATLEWPCGRNQIAGAPALVRRGVCKPRPITSDAHFQRDGNACGGSPARSVENVSGDAAQLFSKAPFGTHPQHSFLGRRLRQQLFETQVHDA